MSGMRKTSLKKIVPILVAVVIAYFYAEPSTESAATVSDTQVEGSGTITRILADDNEGSRHQRFILKLASGQTVLVAHNIDLAPRVADIRQGDTVAYYGEFETNPQGGVIHWTHHDPQGRHIDGWLKHNGNLYQ